MAKFCGKCGTKLNEDTGLCPHCNMGIDNWAQNNTVPYSKSEDPLSRKERKKQKKQSKLNSMTFAQKVKRFILRVCLWLGLWIILGAIIASGLVHFEVIDIPVVSDVLQEIEIMLHLEHKWVEATCVEPRMCEKCDETEGEPLGHSWIPATCVDAQICSVCSEAGEGAIGHNWVDATCTDPRICLTCKETDGDAKGHTWIEASYKTPKTCQICGETDGEPLKPDPVYLVDMEYSDKYGKLWTWSEYVLNYYTHTNPNDRNAYMDMDTPGHSAGEVYDHLGNRYTNGLCVDWGGSADTFYVSYDLGGIYTTFSGVCSLIEGMKGTSYTKYVEIYCDGKLAFTSNKMTKGSSAQRFSIDVTDVKTLRIQYPATMGQNRIATVFDAKLS